jgi:hypothetical protein
MPHEKKISGVFAAFVFIAAMGVSASAADLKPEPKVEDLRMPTEAHGALDFLVKVSNEMRSQITKGNYKRLPAENAKFKEAADNLHEVLVTEDVDFKRMVEGDLKIAVTASQDIADMSSRKNRNRQKLLAEHNKIVGSLNELLARFPDPVQPPAPKGTPAPVNKPGG